MAAAYQRVAGSRGVAAVRDAAARLAGMAAAQERIVARGAWTHGPSTLMSVLGLDRAEVMTAGWSAGCSTQLSPHGLGTAMLGAFAEALHVELPASEGERPGGARAARVAC